MQLGLARTEAKIFLSLAENNHPETAKNIANSTQICREIIYQTLPKLQSKGLIEKILGHPTLYNALPVEDVIENLVKQKTKERDQLNKQLHNLLRDIRNNRNDKNKNKIVSNHFKIVPGKKFIIQKLIESLQKTQVSLEVISSPQRFSPAIELFAESYREALQRGVSIRIATQRHPIKKHIQNILNVLSQNPRFEIRYFNESACAVSGIFDQKEVFVVLSPVADLEDAASLWTDNPCVLGMANCYFQSKWATSATHNTPQKLIRCRAPRNKLNGDLQVRK